MTPSANQQVSTANQCLSVALTLTCWLVYSDTSSAIRFRESELVIDAAARAADIRGPPSYTGCVLTEVSAANYTVRGISVGGIYTSLLVPEIGSMFDVGAAPRTFVGAKRMFLSHGHVDHVGALASFLGIRALSGKKTPLKVFLPAEIALPLTAALSTLATIQRYPLEIDPVPMMPGDVASLGSNLYVRAIRTLSTPVPSLGYVFFRRVDKLLPEFASLSGAEIGAPPQSRRNVVSAEGNIRDCLCH